MKIKFDRKTAKTAKYCALVSYLAASTTKYMYKTQMGDNQVVVEELNVADNTVELGNYE